MKKLSLIITLLFFSFVVAQDENEITYLKLDSSIVYVDNSKATYYTIKFPGDTIKTSGLPNGYIIGEENVQFLKYKYDFKVYTNKSDPSKELEVLKGAMKYEVDYLEGEIFKQKLEIEDETFLNSSGKRFHLWRYKIPEKAFENIESNTRSVKVANYYFLNCIVNDFVSVIIMVSYEGESIEQKTNWIKGISNSIDVFGAPIDIDGTYAKMDAEEEGSSIDFVNEDVGFEVEIPEWANIVKSDINLFWAVTMPDINNVKNAVSFIWFKKHEYKNLIQFNKHFILDYKLGDEFNSGNFLMRNELDSPDNINGISYKIQAMQRNSLYNCQYVTFETKTHYVLVKFVATQETYNVNIDKFNAFVADIKILD